MTRPLDDPDPAAALAELLGPSGGALVRAAAATAAGRHGVDGLLRVLERAERPRELAATLGDHGLRRALALLGLGGAPVEALMADPRDLALLGEALPPVDAVDEARDLEALRAMRRGATLALAAQELVGERSATQAAAVLSALADRLLRVALDRVRADLVARHPEVASVRLAILALGKLGGRELNYSSDVDLVLLRADEDPVTPAERLARAFVTAVQQGTAAGRLFRVDLRLRPYGAAGALVPRLSAAVAYYQETGRTWERQALIKARPVAGDLPLGREFLDRIAPFLWLEHLDAEAIGQIVRLRDRMVANARDAERDVKVGPGGIRDVEFAVQFLQLLHGGADPTLRTPSTTEALALLGKSHLRPAEAAALGEGYELLRRLEHLLQLTCDRELTRLPSGEAAASLARALHLDPPGLEARFSEVRQANRAVLDRLLRAPFGDDALGDAPDPPPGAAPVGVAPPAPTPADRLAVRDLILVPDVAEADAAEVLARYGFADPASVWRHLQAMLHERSPLLSPSGRVRISLAGLLPRLLQAIVRRPDPDRTVRNFQRATASLGAKATVYELMAQDDDVLELLVGLAAGSDVLIETLAGHPGVLDEVVDRLLTRAPLRSDEVQAEFEAALEQPEASAPRALRELRALYLLQVAMPDLAGRANVQNTARGLGELAEGAVRAFAAHATRWAARRHGGLPEGGELYVLAAGKLGGRELAYGSDCDLILAYAGHAPAPDGVTAAAFWGEVAQRVLTLGEGAASVEGPLLPMDLRLRPGGRKAPLAVQQDAALAYYRGEALGETAVHAERLALQKARRITAAGEGFAARLEAALYERDYGPDLWDALADVRRQQIAQAAPDDLKRAAGSMSDVELTASALALVHGRDRPALRDPNTAHLLDALERVGLLSTTEHADLRTGYALLRRLGLRMRVRDLAPRPLLPKGTLLRAVALAMGYHDVGAATAEEHLTRELAFHRRRIAAVCRAIAARERGARVSPPPSAG